MIIQAEPRSALLQRLEPLWQHAQGKKSCRLLRLSILRELTRSIHTLRSELMATDTGTGTQDLARRENYLIASFQNLDLVKLTLTQIYDQSASASPSARSSESELTLPDPLRDALDVNKLKRLDRRWEAEIVREALQQGWNFWQLEVSTAIHAVENFARYLSEGIWPHGVILFAESDGFIDMPDSGSSLTNIQNAHWRGRWFVVLDSKMANTQEFNLEFKPFPEADPKWKRLYPPISTH